MQETLTPQMEILFKGKHLVFLLFFLMSALVIPLTKSGECVRPVAMGEVWRHLTSKVVLDVINTSAKAHLLPFSTGCGCERWPRSYYALAKPLGSETLFF